METLTPGNEPTQAPKQESVLEDIFDTREYDKKIKQAQNGLFIVAAIYLLVGIIQIFSDDSEDWLINTGVIVVVAAIFIALALWAKYKPLTALIIALALYLLIFILNGISDPSLLLKGVLYKAAMVVLLIKGIVAANDAQQIKKIGK